mmetsp:Transcript_89121/g.256915  ORF Transcript_89121/g.256915 Transcript_89121/m.256915 type:complete len:630 (-) Transcript_89121:263-2152(-)
MIAHNNVQALLRKHSYTEIKKVGEGSFGKAILVGASDGSRLICKMVDVSKASRKEMEDAVKEGKLLAGLQHPYIVRYRESFTDNGWLCILMDFCEGGDLTKQVETHRRQRTPIPEDKVLKWFTQAILALKYIHDKHILHRDLKPSNFFLTKSGSMKMGDFGIAKVLACTIAVAKTQIGTPYYLSPELCQEKPYAWPSDIWAMGCILYELCSLKVPFDAPSIAGLVQKIVKGAVPTILNSAYSAWIRELCTEMLNRTPDRRPGTTEILERPQIKTVVENMVEEAEDVIAFGGGGPGSAAPSPSASSRSAAGREGGYKKGDQVEYYSTSHNDWLPATVVNVDAGGRIIIDLKPSTWISKEEQATKVRSRGGAAQPPARAASPMHRRSPSLQRAPSAGPPERNTPRSGGGGMRAPSPMNRQRTPSGAGCASPMMQRSPSNGGVADRPVWNASPMRERSPSVGSRLGAGGNYRKGDQVEYYSPSHKDWLPASVINADFDGRIIIDLKPNTWLSKEDIAARVRPRGGAGGRGSVASIIDRPGSRGGTPGLGRNPSAGALAAGTPRGRTPMGGRAPSPGPWRAGSREPPARAESPFRGAAGAGMGTPRMRPPHPHLPPRVVDSPLRNGGRFIAGT